MTAVFRSASIRRKYDRLHEAVLHTADAGKLADLQGLEHRLIDCGEDVPEADMRKALTAVCGCGDSRACVICVNLRERLPLPEVVPA